MREGDVVGRSVAVYGCRHWMSVLERRYHRGDGSLPTRSWRCRQAWQDAGTLTAIAATQCNMTINMWLIKCLFILCLLRQRIIVVEGNYLEITHSLRSQSSGFQQQSNQSRVYKMLLLFSQFPKQNVPMHFQTVLSVKLKQGLYLL